jgi:DNA-binding PadR family transcriptional regulator
LHFLQREVLTEWDLRQRIQSLGGERFWRPSTGTISKVVRDLLVEGQVEGPWVDPEGRRKRPLHITDAGRDRLRVLLGQLRGPIEDGQDFFRQILADVYGLPRARGQPESA